MNHGRNSRGKATQTFPNTDPSTIDFTKLQPINDTVVFYWVDDSSLEFQTTSGIIIQRALSKNKDRWGEVVAIGPQVTQVSIGEFIVPEKVNNPFGALFNGLELWACLEENIIMATTDYNDTKVF